MSTPWDAHAGNGTGISTIPELLAHMDVRTSMIYTHELNRGPLRVKILADNM
jgi:hypothetical protein